MTRCDEFYDKVEKDGNFCGMSESTVNEVKQVIEFKKEHTDLSAFNQKTIMPLIREQDPEIQQKVISLVESAGKEKVMNYGTERKMKAALNRYKDTNPEAVKEIKEIKPMKLWNMLEQAEYTRQYVKVMIMNGATPASIRELVVKAIGVVEQE